MCTGVSYLSTHCIVCTGVSYLSTHCIVCTGVSHLGTHCIVCTGVLYLSTQTESILLLWCPASDAQQPYMCAQTELLKFLHVLLISGSACSCFFLYCSVYICMC